MDWPLGRRALIEKEKMFRLAVGERNRFSGARDATEVLRHLLVGLGRSREGASFSVDIVECGEEADAATAALSC